MDFSTSRFLFILVLSCTCHLLGESRNPAADAKPAMRITIPPKFQPYGAEVVAIVGVAILLLFSFLNTALPRAAKDLINKAEFALLFTFATVVVAVIVASRMDTNPYHEAISSKNITTELCSIAALICILYAADPVRWEPEHIRDAFSLWGGPPLRKDRVENHIKGFNGTTQYLRKTAFLFRHTVWPFVLLYALWFNWMLCLKKANFDNFIKTCNWTVLFILIIVHFLVVASSVWSFGMNIALNFIKVYDVKDADYIFISPHPDEAMPPSLSKIKTKSYSESENGVCVSRIYIKYKETEYVYDQSWDAADSFSPLAYPINKPYGFYFHSEYNDDVSVRKNEIIYGKNKLELPGTSVIKEWAKLIYGIDFIFSSFGILLYVYCGYYIRAFYNTMTKIQTEYTVCYAKANLFKSTVDLRNTWMFDVYRGKLAELRAKTPVKTKRIGSEDLLPGDVVILNNPKPLGEEETMPLSLYQRLQSYFEHMYKTDYERRVEQRESSDIEAKLEKQIIPADMILLDGAGRVNQASKTGESVVIYKTGILREEADKIWDMEDKGNQHTLFAGTRLLQVSPREALPATQAKAPSEKVSSLPSSAALSLGADSSKSFEQTYTNLLQNQGHVLAMVVRTGFSSTQGQSIEGTIHKPNTAAKEYKKWNSYSLGLVISSVFFSLIMCLYDILYIPGQTFFNAFKKCMFYIVDFLPQNFYTFVESYHLAIAMSLACSNISVNEPPVLPIAGKLDVCFFDKTGTLTTENLVLLSVVLIDQVDLKMKCSTFGDHWRSFPDILDAIGICHSLSLQLFDLGDAVERVAFKATGYELLGGDNVRAVPYAGRAKKDKSEKPHAGGAKKSKGKKYEALGFKYYSIQEDKPLEGEQDSYDIHIERRFPFNPDINRMSSFAMIKKARPGKSEKHYYMYAVKGQPEAIADVLFPAQSPLRDTFLERSDHLAAQGYRVIAMALRIISHEKEDTIENYMNKSEPELREGLKFVGFLVYDDPLKEDSISEIRRLILSGHRTIMITGDQVATAAKIAKDLVLDPRMSPDIVNKFERMASQFQPSLASPAPTTPTSITETPGGPGDPARPSLKVWDEHIFCTHTQLFLNKSKRIITIDLENKTPRGPGGPGKPSLFIYDRGNKKGMPKAVWRSSSETETLRDFLEKYLEKNGYRSTDTSYAITERALNMLIDNRADSTTKQYFRDVLLDMICVFAKFSASGKGRVVSLYKQKKWRTLMCGDGANDVSGWREAHIGIALTNADTEMSDEPQSFGKSMYKIFFEKPRVLKKNLVAPIIAHKRSISAVRDVICGGRVNLLNLNYLFITVCLDAMMKAYCIFLSTVSGLEEHEMITSGTLLLPSLFRTFTAASTPHYYFVDSRPRYQIFKNPHNPMCIVGQFSIHFITMTLCFISIKKFAPDARKKPAEGEQEPSLYSTASYLVGTGIQITSYLVNLIDEPYRAPLFNGSTRGWMVVVFIMVLFIVTFEFHYYIIALFGFWPWFQKYVIQAYFNFAPIPYIFRYIIACLILGNFLLSYIFSMWLRAQFLPTTSKYDQTSPTFTWIA